MTRALAALSLAVLTLPGQAASLSFAPFAVPGATHPGLGVASDPTIRPYLAPDLPAGLGLALSVDLRGDGRPHVIVCHGAFPPQPAVAAPCRFLRPEANGTLTDVTRALLGDGALPSVTHPREIVTGDFNHDGTTDLFIAAHGYDAPPFPGERNVLLVSNAAGGFDDRSASLPQDFSHSACAGDVDGDGHLDLYVGNLLMPVGPYLLKGKGDGTFERTTAGLPAFVANLDASYLSCAIADVDGDGHDDLLLGNWTSVPVRSVVLYGDGHGDFTKRAPYALPAGTQPIVVDMLPFDVDRDGHVDLVLTSQASNASGGGFDLQVLINRGDGTFVDETMSRLPASPRRDSGPFCAFMRTADFDGDGWEDLYCDVNSWDTAVPRVWKNNRNGTWTPVPASELSPDLTLSMLQVVDFDHDGAQDLVRLGWGGTAPDIGYVSYRNTGGRMVPSPPVGVTANGSDGRAIVSFSAPLASGQSPILQYTVTCRRGALVASASGTVAPITVAGLANDLPHTCEVRAANAAGSSLSSASVRVMPSALKSVAVEYFHAGFGHYFLTAQDDEISGLDAGAYGGAFARTGRQFAVWNASTPGSVAVCRFFTITFAPKSSHFYTANPAECDGVKLNPDWEYEKLAFHVRPPGAGTCPAGTVPVFRVYNAGSTGAPNHRFTRDAAVRDLILAQGFVSEGVAMCAPW
jgi:hypothetical protein